MFRIIELQQENLELKLQLAESNENVIQLNRRLNTNTQLSDNRLELNDSYKEYMDSLDNDIKFYKNLLKKSMEQTTTAIDTISSFQEEVSKLKNIIKMLQGK